jgi:hypothetical protein
VAETVNEERRLPGQADRQRHDRSAGEESAPDDQLELADGETVLFSLPGVGSSMVATTERVVLARDGMGFRPRSGRRSYPLDSIVAVTIDGGSQRSGRIVLRLGPHYYQAISMFFDASRAEEAADAVRVLRVELARRRERDRRLGPSEG